LKRLGVQRLLFSCSLIFAKSFWASDLPNQRRGFVNIG
jgi:hypothetical protein